MVFVSVSIYEWIKNFFVKNKLFGMSCLALTHEVFHGILQHVESIPKSCSLDKLFFLLLQQKTFIVLVKSSFLYRNSKILQIMLFVS